MYRLFVTEIDLCVIKVGILGIGKYLHHRKISTSSVVALAVADMQNCI